MWKVSNPHDTPPPSQPSPTFGHSSGSAAYATYIVPTFISIANWPAALIPIDILIGGLLSLATSGFVTWWALRRQAT